MAPERRGWNHLREQDRDGFNADRRRRADPGNSIFVQVLPLGVNGMILGALDKVYLPSSRGGIPGYQADRKRSDGERNHETRPTPRTCLETRPPVESHDGVFCGPELYMSRTRLSS